MQHFIALYLKPSLFILIVGMCLTAATPIAILDESPCDIEIEIDPELHFCPDEELDLCAEIFGNYDDYVWLEDGDETNYDLCDLIDDLEDDTEFTLVVTYENPNNLIENGDFEDGDTGFDTDYDYRTLGDPFCYGLGFIDCEGTYSIVTNPMEGHTGFDDCTHDGNMMVVNGASNEQEIWCTEVCIDPDDTFTFTFEASSVNSGSPGQFSVEIDGDHVGDLDLSSSTCSWEDFAGEWTAYGQETVRICILNENTATSGNDFAIDNIEFYQTCYEEVSFIVEISEMEIYANEPDTVSCFNEEVEIMLDIDSRFDVDYIDWDTDDGDIIDIDDGDETLVAGAGGTYYVTVTDEYGCEFTAEYIIEENFTEPDVDFAPVTLIDCANPSVPITAITDIESPLFHWEDELDNVVGDTPTIMVTEGGTYYVTITDAASGCEEDDDIEIEIDASAPYFELSLSNELTCNMTTATISTLTPQTNVSWTSDNGFPITAVSDLITVDAPGAYYATVTFDNGCEHTDTIEVNEVIPFFEYQENFTAHINCSLPSSQVTIDFDPTAYQIQWTGTAANYGTAANIFINEAGTYIYNLIDNNGCIKADTLIITEDFVQPQVSSGNADLQCDNPSALIYVEDTSNLYEVDWIHENGTTYVATDSAYTDQPGWVYYSVTAANGCMSTDSLLVESVGDFPIVSIEGDTLTCDRQMVSLQGIAIGEIVSHDWVLPDGSISNGTMLDVTEAGLYRLSVTNMTGCSSTTEFLVVRDTVPPLLQPLQDIILSCNQPTIMTDVQILTEFSSISWTGPGQNSGELNIEINEPGEYNIQVTGANGCVQEMSLFANLDTITPVLLLEPAPLLDCEMTSFVPIIIDEEINVDYLWTLPDGSLVTQADIEINTPGAYQLAGIAENGCRSEISFLVDQDVDLPQFSATATPLTCRETSTEITTTTDISYDISYFLDSNEVGTGTNLTTATAEPITIVVTDDNGCSNSALITIEQDTIPIEIQVTSDQLGCQVAGVLINVDANETIQNVSIYDEANNYLGDLNETVTEAGTYTIVAEGDNGCVTTETLLITTDTSTVAFALDTDLLTCDQTTVPININTQSDYTSSVLLDQNNTQLSAAVFPATLEDVSLPGNYQVIVTGTNGCTSIQEILVPIDTTTIEFAVEVGMINCKSDPVPLEIITTDNYRSGWITNLTTQEEQPITAVNEISEVATYEVVLIADNGCLSSELISVLPDPNVPNFSQFVVETLDCDGNAAISGINIEGGTGPYDIYLDGNLQTEEMSSLPIEGIGVHELMFVDQNGCILDTSFTVEPVTEVEAFLTPELSIAEGTDQQLILELNKPLSEISSIEWLPANGLSCYDCLEPIFDAIESVDYTVTVIDQYGCETMLTIRLLVQTSIDIYIPNIVLLDRNDSRNDRFTIFTGLEDIEEVESLSIYDRWGNQIFVNKNFQPNDLDSGWDGSYNKIKIQPGVYVYKANIKYKSGEVEVFAGDVTVVR